jgi:hypothetical protein
MNSIFNPVTPSDSLHGLANLDWRIQELVIPDIRETFDLVRKLKMEDEALEWQRRAQGLNNVQMLYSIKSIIS